MGSDSGSIIEHDHRSRKAIRHDQSLVEVARRPATTAARGAVAVRGTGGSLSGRAGVPPSSSLSGAADPAAGGRRRRGAGTWYYGRHRLKTEGPLILQGNVDVRQVNLAFKVDGRIETLTVDEGDPVKPGQVLATLDKRYFDDELRLARAGATI